jgi:hypothetical protein
MAMNNSDKQTKKKALDLMIMISGQGPKGSGKEEGGDYKEPSSDSADMEEDMNEEEDATCKCGEPMVCSGCDKPESECNCD